MPSASAYETASRENRQGLAYCHEASPCGLKDPRERTELRERARLSEAQVASGLRQVLEGPLKRVPPGRDLQANKYCIEPAQDVCKPRLDQS